MVQNTYIVWLVTFTSTLLALGGILCGGIGVSWWSKDDDLREEHKGLWRTCTKLKNLPEVCQDREKILHFTAFEGKVIKAKRLKHNGVRPCIFPIRT